MAATVQPISSVRSPLGPVAGLVRTRWDTAPVRWLRHLVEMVAVMLIGMEVLFGEASAIAATLGIRNLMLDEPAIATVVMAMTMAIPMALWMDYRGHPRRATAEMSAAMLVPAAAVLAVGGVANHDVTGVYHPLMYAAMVGLMLYRRVDYSSHRH